MIKTFFNYLVFPGFIFSAVIGLIAGWVDRKVSARLQWRVGPPWHQNFTDIIKLFGKEIIVPLNGRWTFLLAPYIGLLGLTLAATILGKAAGLSFGGFSGDLIVILYLLLMPAASLIIGASASGNPLASVGASREMKLVLAYELPLILSVIAVAIKAAGAIRLEQLILAQSASGSFIFSFSGALAFIAALIATQAKLGLAPFDVSEAEQEIMAGVLIEYSGLPLAVYKLNKAILLYTMPLFLILLFLGKDLNPLFMIGKFLIILVLFILIKNTNPRLRIDQAMRFLWGPVTLLAIAAIVLAALGK
ncbi:MAG: complex I subunit 1 family protein [Candidatus Omnitrophota bacterium]